MKAVGDAALRVLQQPLEEGGVLGSGGGRRLTEALLLVAQQHVQQIGHLPPSLSELLHHRRQLQGHSHTPQVNVDKTSEKFTGLGQNHKVCIIRIK